MNSLLSLIITISIALPFSVAAEALKFPTKELIKVAGEVQANGSLFSHVRSMSLYSDLRARHKGDIVTIILSENTNARKTASTSTSKSSTNEMLNPTLLGKEFSGSLPSGLPLGGLALSLENIIDASRSFDGAGDASQSNTLSGSVSALVVHVMPNGYLKVSGEKIISINQGDEFLRIEGYIRPKDIRSDNTILSKHVANARISYGGSGVINDSNSMGWLSKIFNSKWWPF